MIVNPSESKYKDMKLKKKDLKKTKQIAKTRKQNHMNRRI